MVVREGTPEVLLTELQSGRIDLIVGPLTSPTDEMAVRRTLYAESVELVTRRGTRWRAERHRAG